MKNGIIILAVLFVLLVLVYLLLRRTLKKMGAFDEEEKEKVFVSKDDDFQTILKKFNVPETYYKVVISQSHSYNVINCPAVLWKEDQTVHVLVFKRNPEVYDEEMEDFFFVTSGPFINFKQIDGSYYPDWAYQSKEMKDLFLPYVEMGIASGGIDYDRQQYWAGTMCVYAKSLAEIFHMMGHPLSDYELKIDNPARMREDGALPPEMLAQYVDELKAEKKAKAEAASSAGNSDRDMEAVWEAIRRLEKQTDGVSTEQINRLNAYLLSEKRYEDLERSTKDPEYQKTLLKELESSL